MRCADAYCLKKAENVAQGVGEAGIVVHRLKSRFGFLSPLITQQTGHPGLKARAERAIFRRSFDVVHFHNISLIGGPPSHPFVPPPRARSTLHESPRLCPHPTSLRR